MRDWILGLEKAATSRKPGVGDFDWGEVSSELSLEIPDELRDLYKTMNGAAFSNGVRLHPLRGDSTRTVVDESRQQLPSWRFGQKADGSALFAVQRAELTHAEPEVRPPEWVSALPDAQWVYGTTKEGAIKLYRSLEQLLGALVPPAETEEFGDVTYARAMSTVDQALSDLGIPPLFGRAAKASKPAAKKGKSSGSVKAVVKKAKPRAKAAKRTKPVAKKKVGKVGARRLKSAKKVAAKKALVKKRR